MMSDGQHIGAYRKRTQELEVQLGKADLERETFIAHIARQERRNELLQSALDDSIEREAGLQAQVMDLTAANARLLAAVGAASLAVVAAAAPAPPHPEPRARPTRPPQLRRADGLHWRTARAIERLRPLVAALRQPFTALHLAKADGCAQVGVATLLRDHAAHLGVELLARDEWPRTGATGRPSPFYRRRAEVAAIA